MKNAVLLLMTACALCLGSCKKDDSKKSPTTTTTAPTNGWKLGTTSYATVFVARIPANPGTGPVMGITAFDAVPSGSSSSSNTFIAYFATAPTANGTYHVVQYPGGTALTATQVGIVAGGPSATYTSTGAGSVDVTVTITGGKLKIVVPAVPLKKTGATDELSATGTIVEM